MLKKIILAFVLSMIPIQAFANINDDGRGTHIGGGNSAVGSDGTVSSDLEMGNTPYSIDGGTSGIAFDPDNDGTNELTLSGEDTNPILTLFGYNAQSATNQSGYLESHDYGGGNAANNIIFGADAGVNVRIQTTDAARHIGINPGSTTNSTFTVEQRSAVPLLGLRAAEMLTGGDTTAEVIIKALQSTTPGNGAGLSLEPTSGYTRVLSVAAPVSFATGMGLNFLCDTDDTTGETTGRCTVISITHPSTFNSLRISGYDIVLQISGTTKAYLNQDGGFRTVPPAAQTIASGNTITSNGCGGMKLITAAGAVTTSTTNTFTAPATGKGANEGCIMHVCNVGAQNITLDNNANFKSAGGSDVVVTADDCVMVGSTGASGVWYQLTALEAN